MSSRLLYLAQKVQCLCTQKNMKNYFMHTNIHSHIHSQPWNCTLKSKTN